MHQNQNTWVNYRKEPIDLETIIDLSVKLAKSPVWTKYLRTSKIVALFLGPITISLTGLFNKENGISIKDFMLDRKPTLKCSDAPKSFIYSVYSACFSLQKASCSELPMIRHSFSSKKKMFYIPQLMRIQLIQSDHQTGKGYLCLEKISISLFLPITVVMCQKTSEVCSNKSTVSAAKW